MLGLQASSSRESSGTPQRVLCTVGVHSECAVTECWRGNDIREYFKAGEQPLGGMIDMSEAVTDYSLRIKDTGTILSLH